jgi:hypothetical protein
MRILILLFGVVLVFFTNIYAYELDESNLRLHEKTMTPQNSRYEFVQSHIAARSTFKVDKFTGQVYQLVQAENGNITWQEIVKIQHQNDKRKDAQVNYQFFMSGMAAKFTFLINVWTGATWQLTEDTKTEEIFWDPIK